MSNSKPLRQGGVTLIELILFIVIVSVAVVGILGVMNLTTRHSADPLRRKQALMIAEALLEEVELAQFTYCEPNTAKAETATSVTECTVRETFGRDGSETRPFDNVNDYANADGTPSKPFNDVNGQILDVNNQTLPGSQGYSVTLTMKAEDLGMRPDDGAGIAGGTVDNPEVLHITIEVTYDAGQSVKLDGYRARYAPQVE